MKHENIQQLKQQREAIEKMIKRGEAHHGLDFYDHPVYAELLAKKRSLTAEIMKPEPSYEKEWKDIKW